MPNPFAQYARNPVAQPIDTTPTTATLPPAAPPSTPTPTAPAGDNPFAGLGSPQGQAQNAAPELDSWYTTVRGKKIQFQAPKGADKETVRAAARAAGVGDAANRSLQFGKAPEGPTAGQQADAMDPVTGAITRGVDFVMPVVDEIASAATAAGLNPWRRPDPTQDFGQNYHSTMHDAEDVASATDAVHPTATRVGRVGAFLGSLPLAAEAKFLQGGSKLTTALRYGAAGGAYGGANAYATNPVDDRWNGVPLSAALGTGIGLVTPAIAGVAGTIANRLNQRLGITDAIRRYVLRQPAEQSAEQAAADVLSTRSPQKPSDMRARAQEFRDTGHEPTLTNVVDEGGRGVIAAMARRPGPGRQIAQDAYDARRLSMPERIDRNMAAAVEADAGGNPDVSKALKQPVDQTVAGLTEKRSADMQTAMDTNIEPVGTTVYHGGAKLDPSKAGVTFLTPDRKAAESYVGMHNERFNTPGEVGTYKLNLKNPLDLGPDTTPPPEIVDVARKAGIDPQNLEYGTTSSWFDPALNPPGASKRLIQELKNRGYDGVRTLDVPWSGSDREEGKYIEAHIPFDNKAISSAEPTTLRNATVPVTPRMFEILNTADGQRAIGQAMRTVTDKPTLDAMRGLQTAVRSAGKSIDPRLPPQVHQQVMDQLASQSGMTVDIADRLARKFNAMADTAPADAQRALRGFGREIRDHARTTVPEYDQALQKYAGVSKSIDAVNTGGDFLTPNKADEFANRAAKLSDVNPTETKAQPTLEGGKFSVNTSPTSGGWDLHHFEYTAPNGEVVKGRLAMEPNDPTSAAIDVGGKPGSDWYAQDASRIGAAGVKDLGRHLAANFPDLKTIGGLRVSGARGAAGRPGAAEFDLSKFRDTTTLPSDRQLAQQGARRAVQQAAGENISAAPGVARKIAVSPEQNIRNNALFSPLTAENLGKSMAVSARDLTDFAHIAPNTGSATALRTGDDEAANAMLGAIGHAKTGNFFGAALKALQTVGVRDQDAQKIVEMAVDPKRTDELMNMLEKSYNKQTAQKIGRVLGLPAIQQTGRNVGGSR